MRLAPRWTIEQWHEISDRSAETQERTAHLHGEQIRLNFGGPRELLDAIRQWSVSLGGGEGVQVISDVAVSLRDLSTSLGDLLDDLGRFVELEFEARHGGFGEGEVIVLLPR